MYIIHIDRVEKLYILIGSENLQNFPKNNVEYQSICSDTRFYIAQEIESWKLLKRKTFINTCSFTMKLTTVMERDVSVTCCVSAGTSLRKTKEVQA